MTPEMAWSLARLFNMNRVIDFPAVKENYAVLAQAAELCASYQVRTRATVVGNICNASPAGDTIGACMLLDGILDIHGLAGMRQELLSAFFLGPGKTTLQPGDIVTGIRLPVPAAGTVGRYVKHGRNKVSDLAIVGITVVGYPQPAVASAMNIRLALASVAPVPLVVNEVEAILSTKKVDVKVIAEAAEAAMQACHPIDDVRGSARYRKLMVRNLSIKALTEVWERLTR